MKAIKCLMKTEKVYIKGRSAMENPGAGKKALFFLLTLFVIVQLMQVKVCADIGPKPYILSK